MRGIKQIDKDFSFIEIYQALRFTYPKIIENFHKQLSELEIEYIWAKKIYKRLFM